MKAGNLSSRRGTVRCLMVAAGLTVGISGAAAEGELNSTIGATTSIRRSSNASREEFDVKVNLDTYGSNEEMLAKIQAGATGYDIVFPSVHMHDIMPSSICCGRPTSAESRTSRISIRVPPGQDRPERGVVPALCLGHCRHRLQQEQGPQDQGLGRLLRTRRKRRERSFSSTIMRETIGIGHIMNGIR
jgi:spermidine/putrescine transport system substrate-binding protein